MLTKKYIDYYISAVLCYIKQYRGYISFYGIENNNGFTFIDVSLFTMYFVLFFIFPILIDILLLPFSLISYFIIKLVEKVSDGNE